MTERTVMRRVLSLMCLAAICAAPLAAQQATTSALPEFAQAQPPRPGQAPQTPRPPQGPPATTMPVGSPPRVEMATQVTPAPPRLEPMPTQNVKIDVVITDSAAPTKRTVTILTAEGRNGRVRSQRGNIMLNVDAHPQYVRDGRIQLNLTVEYMPEAGPQMSMINESLSFLIVDGKPTIVSQAADPTGDRKVTVEVTATIVK